MIRRTHPTLAAVAAALVLAACAAESARQPGVVAGDDLTILVAPLSLPGLVDACYGLEVFNEAGELVWSRAEVCATRFGDGASEISYVGTCDATDPDADGDATNVVALRIEGLYGPDGADADATPDLLADWKNPCAAPYAPDGCRRPVVCRENADVTVAFDLTVMRAANQGFFDVAVNFEDIFCAAKVDCAYDVGGDDVPIQLVFDPATGERVQTVVWALACTDGDAGATTHLYMSDVELRCGADTYRVPAAAGPGNVYPNGSGAPAPLVQAMVFEGRELLETAAATRDMRYWNVALGLDAAYFAAADAPDCTLHARATASRGPLPGGATPTGATYPVIVAESTASGTPGRRSRPATRRGRPTTAATTGTTRPASTARTASTSTARAASSSTTP